jgi:hypothetical protein
MSGPMSPSWYDGSSAIHTHCCKGNYLYARHHTTKKMFHYTPRRRLDGEVVYLLLILDLGTRWSWVVNVTPWLHFSPGVKAPGTHCRGGWVGLRVDLNTDARRKILLPLPGMEPQPASCPARSQTLYCLSYLAHHHNIQSKKLFFSIFS